MNGSLQSLERRSVAVAVFAAVLCLAALLEIGFAGREVARYYDRRAVIEELARGSLVEPPPDYPIAAAYDAYFNEAVAVPDENEIVVTAERPTAWRLLREPAVLAGIVLVLALIGFVASTLLWVVRAHGNLVRAGQRPRYGPQRALMAYVLPVANLVLPADAMRELYHRSHGEHEDLADASVDDVTAWWTAGIAGSAILSLLVGKYLLDLATNLAIVTPLWMEYVMVSFALILLLLCAGLFARLTRIVTRAQCETLPDAEPGTPAVRERPSVRVVGD